MLYKIFFFFLFLFVGFYSYYLYKYPKPFDRNYLFTYYPKDLVIQKGGLLKKPITRIQHFKNFPFEKDRGTIRIGAFGDSYTYGAEVESYGSYPYQLQKLFMEKYPDLKVEVLNFGISGDSFQGQFFLWEMYRKKYQLDYILFGPKGFQSIRDSSFEYHKSLYPKSRFVLNKEGLKQVSIKGESLEEKYKNYYSLIPSSTALYYDRRPFQMLERLLPVLKEKLSNPWYYTKFSEREEISQINKILLNRIRKEYDQKILMFLYEYLSRDYRDVKKIYNLNIILERRSVFYRIFSHHSILGNESISRIYFNALMGNKSFSLPFIKCYFVKNNKNSKKTFSLDMSSVQSIKLTDKIRALAELKKNSRNHYHYQNFYHQNKIGSDEVFISFFNTDRFLSAPIFKIKSQLVEEKEIYLKFKNAELFALGPLRALDSHNRFFYFSADYIKERSDDPSYYMVQFLSYKMPFRLRKKLKNIDYPVDLLIGEDKIAQIYLYTIYKKRGKEEKKIFYLVPNKGYEESFLMMGESLSFISHDDIEDQFSPYIEYNLKGGSKIKSLIPDWKCRKEKEPIRLNLPNFHDLKLY